MEERVVFIFVCLTRNPRHAFDIKQEIFDRRLLYNFHDHILDHILIWVLLQLTLLSILLCIHTLKLEYQNAATVLKLPIMLATCNNGKNIVFSAAILFSKFVHMHLIFL